MAAAAVPAADIARRNQHGDQKNREKSKRESKTKSENHRKKGSGELETVSWDWVAEHMKDDNSIRVSSYSQHFPHSMASFKK